MEQSISKEIQERLDKINWEEVKSRFGISRDSLTPFIATQLAYGQMTDLIPGYTEDLSGLFSLKAYPVADEEFWKVKAFTIERPKSPDEAIYLYNQPITSESVKKALTERTAWEGNDGRRKYGLANANAGKPVALIIDGRKQQFLVSIHQPTNRIVGIPVEQVKLWFVGKDGESRGRSMYGATFSEDQVKALCEGKAVRLDGCQTKNGETFSCYVQFDAAQRQVVPCHPGWLKEAQKTGTDLGLNAQKQQEKPAVQEEHKVKSGHRMK